MPRMRKDGTPAKAPERGSIDHTVEVVTEVPEFKRASGYTRTGANDKAVKELVDALATGQTARIASYDKRESANGALYNLRTKYNGNKNQESKVPELKGVFEFKLGPLDEGRVGLFVTKVQ